MEELHGPRERQIDHARAFGPERLGVRGCAQKVVNACGIFAVSVFVFKDNDIEGRGYLVVADVLERDVGCAGYCKGLWIGRRVP